MIMDAEASVPVLSLQFSSIHLPPPPIQYLQTVQITFNYNCIINRSGSSSINLVITHLKVIAHNKCRVLSLSEVY